MPGSASTVLEQNRKEPEVGDEAVPDSTDNKAGVPLQQFAAATGNEACRRRILTLDIETLGLLHHKPLPPMTCACLFDGESQHKLLFYGTTQATQEDNATELIKMLDAAEVLGGFNAVRFDLPYIGQSLGVGQAQIDAWVAKCVDPFLGMRSTTGKTCKLQHLLDLNSLGSKTGSGADAITLAREGRTDELLDYCMNDVLLTHQLIDLEEIRLDDAQRMRLVRETLRWQLCGAARAVPPPAHIPPHDGPGSSEDLVASACGVRFM